MTGPQYWETPLPMNSNVDWLAVAVKLNDLVSQIMEFSLDATQENSHVEVPTLALAFRGFWKLDFGPAI